MRDLSLGVTLTLFIGRAARPTQYIKTGDRSQSGATCIPIATAGKCSVTYRPPAHRVMIERGNDGGKVQDYIFVTLPLQLSARSLSHGGGCHGDRRPHVLGASFWSKDSIVLVLSRILYARLPGPGTGASHPDTHTTHTAPLNPLCSRRRHIQPYTAITAHITFIDRN